MKYANEFKVGVAVVVSVLVLIFGLRFMQDIPLFRGSYELHTEFENVDGLIRGNNVNISGVNVGSVGSVQLDPVTNRVAVVLRIDRGVHVPEGTSALLTGMPPVIPARVELDMGPVDAPSLEDGDRIEGTRQPDVLGSLTDRTDPIINRVDTILAQTNDMLRDLSAVLTDPDGSLNQTLENLNRVTGSLDRVIDAERSRVASILENTDRAVTNLSSFTETQTDSLAVAIRSINSTLVQLERNLASIEEFTDNLGGVASSLDAGEGTLGLMLKDPQLYHSLDSLSHNLNQLISDFQDNPRAYIRHLRLIGVF